MAPIKIYAHVASFGSMFLISVGAAYAISYTYGKSEEEKLSEIDVKFKEQLRAQNSKKNAMESFFNDMKKKNEHPEDKDTRFEGMIW